MCNNTKTVSKSFGKGEAVLLHNQKQTVIVYTTPQGVKVKQLQTKKIDDETILVCPSDTDKVLLIQVINGNIQVKNLLK